MAGRASGNSTSTTGPATCTIVPVFMGMSLRLTAGDLQQFLGDVALPQPVVLELQIVNQRLSGLGSVLHRHHTGALLARLGVKQHEVDEDAEPPRQERTDHRLRTRLEQTLRAVERDTLRF